MNIGPLQKAGLLATEVIAKKDLEKAISDRADWRADESGCYQEKEAAESAGGGNDGREEILLNQNWEKSNFS